MEPNQTSYSLSQLLLSQLNGLSTHILPNPPQPSTHYHPHRHKLSTTTPLTTFKATTHHLKPASLSHMPHPNKAESKSKLSTHHYSPMLAHSHKLTPTGSPATFKASISHPKSASQPSVPNLIQNHWTKRR